MYQSTLSPWPLSPPIRVRPIASQGTNNHARLVHTGAGDFVLKLYSAHSSADAIRYEHGILAWLSKQQLSFAVPAPLKTKAGATLIAVEEDYAVLFHLIKGSRPRAGRSDQLNAVGVALGELHRCLEECSVPPREGFGSYAQVDQVHPAIPDPAALDLKDLNLPPTQGNRSLLKWWRNQIDRAHSFIEKSYSSLPSQVIHGDFTPSNTLVDGTRISGIIDFEFSGPDLRALDVAAGLKFSLRAWRPAPLWGAAAAFCHGYASQVQLTDGEIRAIPQLIHLSDVVSTIWWLGRGIATSEPEQHVGRLTDLCASDRWMCANQARLLAMMARSLS